MRRWRTRELLLSWIVYWLALAGATLGPLASAIWRATHTPHGGPEGDINISVTNTVLTVTVKLAGQTLYAGSRSLLGIALLIAVPPLAIWLLWFRRRPAPEAAPGQDRVR